MMTFFCALLLILCLTGLLSESQAGDSCSGATFSRHINRKLQCGVFKTLAANFKDCYKLCAATLSCFSINMYQSENGTEMCELIKGTINTVDEICLVESVGSEHNELQDILPCYSSTPCSTTRKALQRRWFQLGQSRFKHYRKAQDWQKANKACADHGGSLATIESELELKFITELFLTSMTDPDILTSMNALNYWKLDGYDKDVVLHGGAAYKPILNSLTAVLDLPGTAGSYATAPAVAIQQTSFTIGLWAKLRVSPAEGHLYGYWLNPYMFNILLFKYNDTTMNLVVDVRKKSNQWGVLVYTDAIGSVAVNEWFHVALVWDRANKTARLFQNGVQVSEVTSSADSDDLDLPTPTRSVFDIGYKRDSETIINGEIAGITVFNRALSSSDINKLKDLSDPAIKLPGVWVGKKHAYNDFATQLQSSNSTCVMLRAWDPHGKMDKVECNKNLEFVCKRT